MIVITDGEANDDVSAPSRAAVADGITIRKVEKFILKNVKFSPFLTK